VLAWVAGWVSAMFFLAGSALAAPAPIEHFTKLPAIDDVVVSPSGKRLAVLVFGPDGNRRVAVMNLDPMGGERVVGGFTDADVTTVHWVSDERLVFEAAKRGAEIREGGAGTFAVNHDGSEQRQLIAWVQAMNETNSSIRSKILPYGWFLHSTVDDASDDVFVVREAKDNLGDLKQIELARLNTRTGQLRSLSFGMPEGTRAWLLDQKHEPRLLTAYRGGRQKVYWRNADADADANKWTEVADFDPLTEAGFVPWWVDGSGQVTVTARMGSDTAGLYQFDPVAKRVDPQPLVSVAGFDLAAEPQGDPKTGHLLGLHFTAERPTSYWFDEGLAQIQRGVDAALPAGRSNRLYCGRCESTRFFVVRSSSDKQPGEFFLFDRSKSALTRIGASRPWIDEALQGRRSFHRVSTRDGLQMPVYVTHPPGAAADAALPAVILVHGGPWVRGSSLTWEAEAQFLASRGYRVIQPEFRGSRGFGFRHFKAGWKEWGRAMQDDLVDAVRWAAKERLLDPEKVCVVGASYGGYAALMGPIANPGVYRCAASFAGVTDIGLMYGISWSDTSEAARQYSMPVLIGDPDKDAQRLAMASPLKRVAEIKVPLLLVHGGVDRRVPIEHARKFADAARRAEVVIEQVNYPNEGHGFFDPANHADYFGRLERFLDKSMQPPR
jgi:dienelactone hydrolase